MEPVPCQRQTMSNHSLRCGQATNQLVKALRKPDMTLSKAQVAKNTRKRAGATQMAHTVQARGGISIGDCRYRTFPLAQA